MRFLPAFIVCLLVLSFTEVSAQIGSTSVFQFLNDVPSAKAAALGGGGANVTKGADLSAVLYNPAILDTGFNNTATLSYASYLAGIGLGNFAYAHSFGKMGTYAAGVQFMRYGNFTEADASGDITGSFTAAEYAYYISGARPIDKHFTIGATVKYIYSSLYQYKASGLATDLALLYDNTDYKTTAALILKNAGAELTTYADESRGYLPFEAQLVMSKKLTRAPIQLFLTLQHLEHWDLSRSDVPNLVASQLGLNFDNHAYKNFFVNAGRHVIIGAELLPEKAFNIRVSYNVLRATDYKYTDLNTLGDGLSFGFGLKIGSVNLNYAHAIYHSPFSTDYFTLTTGLQGFYHKAK